jgi:hypothetical protein
MEPTPAFTKSPGLALHAGPQNSRKPKLHAAMAGVAFGDEVIFQIAFGLV